MSDAPSRRDQGSLCPKRPSRRYASDRQKPWRRREALPSTLFRDELRQSNQIVGGGSEGEGPPDAAAREVGILCRTANQKRTASRSIARAFATAVRCERSASAQTLSAGRSS